MCNINCTKSRLELSMHTTNGVGTILLLFEPKLQYNSTFAVKFCVIAESCLPSQKFKISSMFINNYLFQCYK